jgi:methylenetetrahydrofolate dehydrogenase (NADP+) / methenyltetrahydrofolate cyclohydrolase
MIIDGKNIAKELRAKVKEEVAKLQTKPRLVVVLVGDNAASQLYVRKKAEACEEVGIASEIQRTDKDIEEEALLELIDVLNEDREVDGILVQLPLPKHINAERIIQAVDPLKDVDGFHPLNIGKLVLGEEGLQPCTPRGVMKLLDAYPIDLKGKDVVVIGRSIIVGKPVAMLCLERHATVTMCHSRTKDLSTYTKKADVIISAVGIKHLIKEEMVKEGSVVIDVGTIREENKLYGDVDFDNVAEKCSYITPVPGGVGPMTIACLLENTLFAYHQRRKQILQAVDEDDENIEEDDKEYEEEEEADEIEEDNGEEDNDKEDEE